MMAQARVLPTVVDVLTLSANAMRAMCVYLMMYALFLPHHRAWYCLKASE